MNIEMGKAPDSIAAGVEQARKEHYEADPINFAPQGSGEWLRERAGKVTASRFKDVLAKKKDGTPMQKREDYLWELVTERLTGSAADHFASTAMQWGSDNEALARMAYEAQTGAMCEEVGFILHPDHEGVGGSPDSLIGMDGGWEGKCPFNSAVHLQTILGGMPEEHRAQVQGLMWITGRAWWDFTSYDPRLPAPFDLYVERIPRDDAFIEKLAEEIDAFQKDVATMMARLAMMGGATTRMN
jgi:predicted phage-related endonuclease